MHREIRRSRRFSASTPKLPHHIELEPQGVEAAENQRKTPEIQTAESDVQLPSIFDLTPARISKSNPQRNVLLTKKKMDGSFRRPLPSIEAYQQALQFPAESSGRVVLRLERFMGTSNIRPTDPKYMKTLRGKLEVEEKVKWKGRLLNRKEKEYERIRKLIINGHADPPIGMEEIYKHPVFRVNRIIDRLNEFDATIGKEFHVKPPPIQMNEPFEEYKETGFLFGSHPRHYLKVKQARSEVKAALALAEKESKPKVMFHSPQFDGNGKLLPPQKVPAPPTVQEPVGIEPSTRPHSPESKVIQRKVKQTKAKGVHEDIEAAKKRYGINPDDIEKMWKAYESPLIKMINKEEGSNALHDVASKVLGTIKRKDNCTEEFVNKTYRRLISHDV